MFRAEAASLMEQVNSRYYRLRHALSCCPPHPRTIKYDSEGIGHGWNISCRRTRCITKRGWGHWAEAVLGRAKI